MGWLAGTMKDGEVDWLASRSAWSFPRQQNQPSGKGNTAPPLQQRWGTSLLLGQTNRLNFPHSWTEITPGQPFAFTSINLITYPPHVVSQNAFLRTPWKDPFPPATRTLIFSSSSLQYILAYVMINKAISGIYLPPYCQFHLIKT